MASQTSDEIIEKRESHPVATACLVFATLAILASIVLQVLEIRHVRAGFNATERNNGEVRQTTEELLKLQTRVDNLLSGAKVAPADKQTNEELKKRFEAEDGASPSGGAGADDGATKTDDDSFFGDDDDDL